MIPLLITASRAQVTQVTAAFQLQHNGRRRRARDRVKCMRQTARRRVSARDDDPSLVQKILQRNSTRIHLHAWRSHHTWTAKQVSLKMMMPCYSKNSILKTFRIRVQQPLKHLATRDIYIYIYIYIAIYLKTSASNVPAGSICSSSPDVSWLACAQTWLQSIFTWSCSVK